MGRAARACEWVHETPLEQVCPSVPCSVEGCGSDPAEPGGTLGLPTGVSLISPHPHTEKNPRELRPFPKMKAASRGLWGLASTETVHRRLPLSQQSSLGLRPLCYAHTLPQDLPGTVKDRGPSPTALQLPPRTQQDHTVRSHRGRTELVEQHGMGGPSHQLLLQCHCLSRALLFLPVLWPHGEPAGQPVQSPCRWIQGRLKPHEVMVVPGLLRCTHIPTLPHYIKGVFA